MLEFEGTIPCRGNECTLPLQIDFIVRRGNSTPEQLKERSKALAKALQKAFIRRHDFQSLVDTSSKSEKKKAANIVQPTEPIVESKRIDWSMQANELDKNV